MKQSFILFITKKIKFQLNQKWKTQEKKAFAKFNLFKTKTNLSAAGLLSARSNMTSQTVHPHAVG